MAQVSDYEHYKRIKLLGEGAFGKAFLAECVSDNTMCVIKQVDLSKMSDQEKKDTLREAKILESFNHPNIVKFREVYKTKKGKLCIVMDYADGGDLAGKIKNQKGQQNFPENQILDWFTQICLALKHVHDRKIIHRDLKGQNIFLTKTDIVKLGDFGIARVLSTTRENAKTMVGTPYYLSPEIINGKAYSFKSDIWSLGVVLYEMCALKPPFDAQSLTFLAMKIVKGQYSPVPMSFSRELKNLVSTLLQVDPLKRPNVNEILKFPIIQNRIQNFLSKSVKIQEFSHTVLHKQQFVKNNMKFEEIKSVNNEAPIPDYLLKAQKEKDAANPKPPLPGKQNAPQQAINRPVFPPQNNERPKVPVNEPPQSNRIPVQNNNTPSNNAQPKNNYHYRNSPTPQPHPGYEPYRGPKIVEISKDKVPEPIDAVKAIQEQVKNIEERVNNWNRYAAPPEPNDRHVNRPANEPQKIRNNDVGNRARVAEVKQQNQQNQYQRPEPVKKNIDREILGGGGGGMAFNFAPTSNKNANNAGAKKKDLFVAGNAAAKKKPTATPVVSAKQAEIERRENLAQQKLADAKKKQEDERIKKEKKALAEAERKQVMENLRQEKEKEREANRKKMMQDIKNKRGAFKKGAQVEIYGIHGGSLTELNDEDEEESKTAPGSDTKTEPKVSPPKQERTSNRAKEDIRKNISRGFSMEDVIKNKPEEPEEENVSKVKRKPMKRGFTKPAKINKGDDPFNVEIFVPGKKNPLTAEDVNQEQPVYDYPEDHKEPDLFEGIDANSDNGAILESEPDLGDDKADEEGGKDDPFISRLEQDIKFYNGDMEVDPKYLENLQDITNLIDELNNAVNEDGEPQTDQDEGKLNSNRDVEQEDREDDPLDISTENTEPTTNNQVDEGIEAMMDYSKLECLKMKLENILGVDTFLKAYRVIKELLQQHTLDEIEEKYGRNDNYASLFPFMTEEALKNDLGFVFTYVVCEEKAEESHM